MTFKFLVANFGFPTGVRILSTVVAGTTLIAFIFGMPCKDVNRRPVGSVFRFSTWIDKQAFRNRSYTLYVIAVALVYGGFYSIAFHVTEWAEVKGFGTEEDVPGGTGERPGNGGFRTFWFLAIMNGYVEISREHNPEWRLIRLTIHSRTSIIGRLASAFFATQ